MLFRMTRYNRHVTYIVLLLSTTSLLCSKYWCSKGHFNLNQRSFFQKLARKIKPEYVLETGFCTGRSASSVLEATNLKKFISIDINLDYIQPEGRIFAQLLQDDFPQFKIIEEDSKLILTDDFFLKNFPLGIDWATIDGDHSYNGCLQDLERSSAYLSKNGIIIIDDYKSDRPDGISLPQVTNAVDDFCKQHPEFYKIRWNKRGKGFAILTRSHNQYVVANELVLSER